jgi:hypothetical protein
MMVVALAFVFVMSAFAQVVQAAEIQIIANVGDRTSEFRVKPSGKDYLLSLYSSELGPTDVRMGQKNYHWIQSRVEEMAKLKKSEQPCERDLVTVSVVEGSKPVLEYDVCLLAKDERAKSMRSFLNTLTSTL